MDDFDIVAYCSNATSQAAQIDCQLYETFTKAHEDLREGVDVFFALGTGALVFLQQAGFAMVCAGMVREKSVVNIVLKNLLDSCVGAIGFWAIGFAFAYGGQDSSQKTFIGDANFFLRDYKHGFDELIKWYFQFAFAQTAATIVAGVIAERSKMSAYLMYSVFITSFVYPVIVHNAWSNSGYLSPFNSNPFRGVGVLDFAGSGCVHFTGGTTALVAALILGPRRGRFYDENGKLLDHPAEFRPYSRSMQTLGTIFLWVGWIGFNPGSAVYVSNPQIATIVAISAVTTTLSAAAGACSALLIDTTVHRWKTGVVRWDINMCCNGCLAGMVAITASCAVMRSWASVLIGTVAGGVFYCGMNALIYFRVDDAVDAIPVHMGNGCWGIIATGLLADPYYMKLAGYNPAHPGWFYSLANGSGDANLLLCQVCDLLFIITWVVVIMGPYFTILKVLGEFRISAEDEAVGLDIAHHRVAPYDGPRRSRHSLHSRHSNHSKHSHKSDGAGQGDFVKSNEKV